MDFPAFKTDAEADKAIAEFARATDGLFDPQKDLERSINFCFATIRERMAAGGKGWTPK
jgi:hypothetical protein